jgi:hypothetical protein
MTDSIENTGATSTEAVAKPVLTKAERVAKIKASIARLEVQLFNVENDIVAPVAAKKVVPLPEIGATVSFVYGRKTATTEPTTITGTVVAVKPTTEVDGKKLPAQVKVSYGEGFDAAFATIYPAQIIQAEDEQVEQVGEDTEGEQGGFAV